MCQFYLPFITLLFLSRALRCSARPHNDHKHHHPDTSSGRLHPVCQTPALPYDFSAKTKSEEDDTASFCEISEISSSDIVTRQSGSSSADDDFSCSESKPCANGACCSKKTGYCSYGPKACGPDLGHNPSPNDVCWSNCDAVAECGRDALPMGKECPLNVCCSAFGFCGMSEEFCAKGKDKGKQAQKSNEDDDKSGESDDEDSGCQSNCDQPTSGADNGDVQSRVIGYYQAFAHDRKCQNMDFDNIPVGALTHLFFSFGYITPKDFKVAPMDKLKASLFSDLTAVKTKNPDLKAVIALGGWTFNDNNTDTQRVFSDLVSTADNRQEFISNLLSFMRQYAFDGVDFDWEYPGAIDRGGRPEDGRNFVLLLKELQDAIKLQPIDYTVSFTVPTSYWYLRLFDLKAINHVDWINVMSYDLHGVWDSDNPIGSVVLAHTNLTEIESAFDLFWRNDVPAHKLNIGFGFYGRSFQLAQPSCFRPGCEFKGGAEPGPCSNNSGTLSYREIVDIIDHNNLEPYYDKKAGVKYIVWNEDQWVSYDDEETFKQKIDFANKLGLGGMLVWSIDQDTDDLKAMSALLAPKDLSHFQKQAQNTAFWQDISNADCYVTECGGSCQTGFIQTTTQSCGDATKITRHSKGEDSALCCPISAAPDPNKCQWRGTAPSCNGHCHDGEVSLQLNRWGDGKFCEDGNKAYCCETTSDRSNGCYWTNAGGKCSTGDELFTFSGTFLDTVVDALEVFPPTLIGLALEETLSGISIELESRYCCPPDDAKHWSNCAWHGKPGSCDDNRCNTGQQVQLTSAKYGLGESCFPRSERTRVFCCDATDGESPFLPVPLENLFPEPPTGDHINIDSHLKVDNTWGTGSAETDSDEPNDATFGFVVLASPEELQVSLDKRDGSDWEVFDCKDAISEEQQTIKIYCRNENTTNCDKIHLGHGAPGTIVEMPPGCGPSRYAVVKSLVHAETQEFPGHLDKRSYAHSPSIHDLTFDFDWRRVPRDLGDTLLRMDYSNEVGYWDSIVAKAASTKKKRSLEELAGNHKRWLEEEWRDDHHHGALTRDELHKRWFGEDIIAWLKGLSNPDISPEYTHHLSKTFTAKLVEEDWSCNIKGVDMEAHLLIQALMEIDIRTSFGITIIAKLGNPIDLSGSYLRFKNAGEVSAIFTLDALAKAQFHKPFELFNMGNIPGATFSIPKLVTVGPNFRLLATIDASLEFAGHPESRARIAAWDVEMKYPAANDEFKPKNINPVSVDGTGDFQGISMPTFDYSYKVTGSLLAHLQPTFEFGIHFDEMWSIPSATVQLIADGSVELFAESTGSNEEICPFTYGVNVGARLYAHVDAPPAFGWSVPDFDLYPQVIRTPIKGGSCPDNRNLVVRDAQAWRAHRNTSVDLLGYSGSSDELSSLHLHKRVESHGPPYPLPKTGCYFCPGESGEDHTDCASVTGWSDSQMRASTDNTYSILRRDAVTDVGIRELGSSFPMMKRAKKSQSFCEGSAKMNINSAAFKSSSGLKQSFPNVLSYGYFKSEDCNDFTFGLLPSPPAATGAYASEHILEFQLIQIFFNALNSKRQNFYANPDIEDAQKDDKDFVDLCHYLQPYFETLPKDKYPVIGGVKRRPIDHIGWQFPGTDNFEDELVLLDSGVNLSKKGMWGEADINSDDTMFDYERQSPEKTIKNLKDALAANLYHMDPQVVRILVAQRKRVSDFLATIEQKLDGLEYPGILPYEPIDLQSEWDAWSHDRLLAARSKLNAYFDQWLPGLIEGYATTALRELAKKAASAGDDAPQIQIEKIDALAAAVKARPAWTDLPF